MNERNRSSYRHEPETGSVMTGLVCRLIICALLFCAAYLLKAFFPDAAQAVASAVFGDGSYRQAFARLGSAEAIAEAFSAVTGGR